MIEYRPKLNIIHVVVILTLASFILLYLFFVGGFGQIVFLLLLIALLFIALPFYYDLKFDQNTIIHHKKKFVIRSYIETDGAFGASWFNTGVGLFKTGEPQINKFLRISTDNNTYYIYESNCYNYDLIKDALLKNKIEVNREHLIKRQSQVKTLNNIYRWYYIVLGIIAFCGFMLWIFKK